MKKITLLLFIILPSLLFSQVIIEDNFEGINNDALFAIYNQPTTAPVSPATSIANMCTLANPTLNTNVPGNVYMTSWLDASITPLNTAVPPVATATNGIKIIKTTGTTLNDGAVRLGSVTSLSLVMDIKHAGTNASYVKPTGDLKISTTFSANLASTNVVSGSTTGSRTGNGIMVGFYGTLSGRYTTNLDPSKYNLTTTTTGSLNKFIGFVVNPDTGRIAMWTSAQTGSTDNPTATTKAYAGNYLPTATTPGEAWTDMTATGGSAIIHQLSYTVNTTTGTVYNFTLDGASYDWSAYTPFSVANSTDYATIGANSSASKDAYFYNFKVENISNLGLSEKTLDKTAVTVYKKEGDFNINTNGITMKEISVFDIQGRLIMKQSKINRSATTISGLPTKGVLFINIVSDSNKSTTVKVVN